MKFLISACLFSLVFKEFSISASSSNNKKDDIVEQKADIYIDRFHRLKKLAESDLKIVKFFVQLRETWKTTKSDGADPIHSEIDEYINDFERGNGPISTIRWTNQAAENIAKNPIASYRLLRRYSTDLPRIFMNTDPPIFEKIEKLIIPDKMRWPDSEDLKHAADGILWLQHIYNISAEQFSRGSLPGIELRGKLDVAHIYEIGDDALLNKFYALAIEWWEFGLKKIQAENIKDGEREKFTQFLQIAKNSHDTEYKKGDDQNKWLFDHPVLKDEDLNETSIEKRVTRRETLFQKYKGDRESEHHDINIWGVCSGENYQTEEERRRFFCWYEFTVHPRYRIAPLKMEFLSRQPDVYMIHHFVSDSLIKKIRRTAQDEDRFTSFNPNRKNSGQMHVDLKGRGVTSFIWDGFGTTLGLLPLAQNVNDATGLKAIKEDESDKLYVKSYTWATYAKLHTDSMWMANAMHYLNNVDVGGFTAFPRLGFSVKPVKGALVVWFNQHRDQETDQLTQHFSCPVIFGRKQIATKWIFPDPQFHQFPCDLKLGGRFKTKVNGRLDY